MEGHDVKKLKVLGGGGFLLVLSLLVSSDGVLFWVWCLLFE